MRVVRYFDSGFRIGLLAKEGRIYDHIIVMACPIDVKRVPCDDDSQYEYIDADPTKAQRQFRAAAKRLGITERARRLLNP